MQYTSLLVIAEQQIRQPSTGNVTFALLSSTQRWQYAERVLFAVLSGSISFQLLLQLFWCIAQTQELRVRQWRREVNTARKAVGGRSFYATHSPRKLTWTPSSVFCCTCWVVTAILTIIGLFFVPRMPDLVPFHSHSHATTLGPANVQLPPTSKFAPPQWFDPPHRDQIFWLKNVATFVGHSARVSWQVLTISLPATDMPVLGKIHSLLNDSSAGYQVGPLNATSLWLNTTTCINPDAETWPVKGAARHSALAPALAVTDYDAWHSTSAYRATWQTESAVTQMQSVYPVPTLPHVPKAVAASDCRVPDVSCSTHRATALAIQSQFAPQQSSPAEVICSPSALLNSPTAGVLRSLLTPLHSSTALAVRTPLQYPDLQGSCPAADVRTAVTSPDYTKAVEAANPLAGLSTALTVVAAGASPTEKLASSSFTQLDSTFATSNTSQRIRL